MSNVVPDGWNNKIFADAITLSYGKSPKEIFAEDGTYPVVGTGGITGYTNHYLHEGYTTVVGRKGSINNPSFFSDKFWAIDTTYYASNYKDTDAKWFFYLLQSIDLTKYNEASGVPSLNRDTLYSISFIAPPLPEQQKIAAILTSVDEVIEKTQAQINKLKDLKTGMMQELLTRGVGVDGKPHTEFKDSPVGRIPKAWDVVNVGSLLEVIDPQPDHRTPPEVENGIPYVGLGDIDKSGVINFSSARKVPEAAFDKQCRSFDIHKGAFIFGKIGTIGNPSILPNNRFYCLSANVILITCSDIDLLMFIYQIFTSELINEQVKQQTNTTSQPALGIKKVRDFLVPYPSKEEMRALVNTLTSIDQRIAKLDLKFAKYKLNKKALMQDLLTGKVRVNVD